MIWCPNIDNGRNDVYVSYKPRLCVRSSKENVYSTDFETKCYTSHSDWPSLVIAPKELARWQD